MTPTETKPNGTGITHWTPGPDAFPWNTRPKTGDSRLTHVPVS